MKNILSIAALILSSLSFAQQEKIEITYTSRLILPEDFTFQPPGGGSGRQSPCDLGL